MHELGTCHPNVVCHSATKEAVTKVELRPELPGTNYDVASERDSEQSRCAPRMRRGSCITCPLVAVSLGGVARRFITRRPLTHEAACSRAQNTNTPL